MRRLGLMNPGVSEIGSGHTGSALKMIYPYISNWLCGRLENNNHQTEEHHDSILTTSRTTRPDHNKHHTPSSATAQPGRAKMKKSGTIDR
jgi:hypothetical protein